MIRLFPLAVLAVLVLAGRDGWAGKADKKPSFSVDKEKKSIVIECKIAPRKLPHLKQIYPIEVIACWPDPKGKKAHETVVTVDENLEFHDVHKAIMSLGFKPGKPVMGEGKDPPEGPEFNLFLEVPQPDGTTKRLSPDKFLEDKESSKPLPKGMRFRFTGSPMIEIDPEKGTTKYGADVSGTLAVIFPVTNQTVLQTNFTMAEQKYVKKLDVKGLPPEGTPVKLILEAVK